MAEPDLLARAVGGDDEAFAQLVASHRRPVFRHCYRMLGSGSDAEDATQDTLEKAWRGLTSYDGSGPFGAWLHRIATNVCLDLLRTQRARRDPTASHDAGSAHPGPGTDNAAAELSWVEPVSDAALNGPPDPQDEVVAREQVSLAFVAALQRLAPRQRAALLLHDVLGFTHAEVAEVLDITVSAVNSLLSRARESVRTTAGQPQPVITDPRVQDLLRRYLRAWQLADINALVGLVAEDVTFSMPPTTTSFHGRDTVIAFIDNVSFTPARRHGIPVRAGSCNNQLAIATYEPDDARQLVVSGLQILNLAMVGGEPLITGIISYRDPDLALRCGMARVMEDRLDIDVSGS
jgi:RNA polymerase sigma-70 factor (TIGR02960 family)